LKKEKSELHVLIIWEHARHKEDEILVDIANTFNIREKHYITWDPKRAYENFSRFYAIKSRYAKGKMKHCGSGEFLLMVIEDENPIYAKRKTTSGEATVNTNIFDKKREYRNWTGGGHKIHATDSVEETNHNLSLFFGLHYSEYYSQLSNEVKVFQKKSALIGSDGWDSFEQLFKVLNACVNYTVLRNFEGFFDKMTNEDHLDIDLLVANYLEVKLVLNGKEVYPFTKRVVNRVIVGDKYADFDLRSIGDGYMDHAWCSDILDERVLVENKFYSPSNENYLYSLIYHALIHKNKIAEDYFVRFQSNNNPSTILDSHPSRTQLLEVLRTYMSKKGYNFVEPKDLSVGYNISGIELTVSLYRKYVTVYRNIKMAIKNVFT
jgi:hypothetical protein